MASKRKITETVPTEVFESVHNLLAAQGFEKSASALVKEANLDKKKAAANSDNLLEIFTAYKAANPSKTTKKTKVDSSSSSSSDSSDSSEDEAPKKPVVAAKVAAKPVKKDSSDSDSSSSSEDEAPKKPAAAVKAAPAKPAAKKQDSSSDSSSSDSSSEDEAPKKVAPKPVAAKVAKKEESSSSSSSSSDSSSDEEEAPPKKVAKKEAPSTPAAKSAPVISTPAASNGDGKEHKIYVKGLPWLATEAEVRDFFKGCGTIVSTECPMGEDGRPSGTAFVKFSQRSELEAAIALDGQTWPGTERWLKIQEGVDKPDRRSFGGEVGPKPEGCDTVFVGNLPWDVEEEQMREIFSAAGEISSVRFATGEDGGFRGFGHVSFYNGNDVEEAIKLAGTQLNGRAIRVDFAPPRNRESTGGRGRGDGGRGGGRGRGDGGRGRGGGRGTPTATVSKAKGSIAVSAGKKMTFDE